MKTDKEKLIELLTEFGVGFELEENNRVVCTQGKDKVDGYHLFYTTFDFDKDGKFTEMGAWE